MNLQSKNKAESKIQSPMKFLFSFPPRLFKSQKMISSKNLKSTLRLFHFRSLGKYTVETNRHTL